MDEASRTSEQTETPPQKARLWRRVAVLVVAVLLLYLAAAYLVMPAMWERYVKHHPSLDEVPGITQTKDGIPGDPLNVALVGTATEVKRIMASAKWYAADPLGLHSDLQIAADTVLKRPDDQAPVSSLYLFGARGLGLRAARGRQSAPATPRAFLAF